jgi:hypothetical protein
MVDEADDTALLKALLARLNSLDGRWAKAVEQREEAVKAADEQFRLALAGIEEERSLVSRLLDIEKHKGAAPANNLGGGLERLLLTGGMPIGDFLVRVVKANGPQSKDGFRAFAERAGYHIDGRGIHAAVVNGIRGGRLELRDDGRYGLSTEASRELKLEPMETPF